MNLLNTVNSVLEYENRLCRRGQVILQFPSHNHKNNFIADLNAASEDSQ